MWPLLQNNYLIHCDLKAINILYRCLIKRYQNFKVQYASIVIYIKEFWLADYLIKFLNLILTAIKLRLYLRFEATVLSQMSTKTFELCVRVCVYV